MLRMKLNALFFFPFFFAFLNFLLWQPAYASDIKSRYKPERNGFTLELGTGLGAFHLIPSAGDSETNFSVSPPGLRLGLGIFFNNDISLMARYAMQIVIAGSKPFMFFYIGGDLQYWISDRWAISAGAGIIDDSIAESSDSSSMEVEGWALSFRPGYSFFVRQNHSLRLSLEIMPAFLDQVTYLIETINFEWQYF